MPAYFWHWKQHVVCILDMWDKGHDMKWDHLHSRNKQSLSRRSVFPQTINHSGGRKGLILSFWFHLWSTPFFISLGKEMLIFDEVRKCILKVQIFFFSTTLVHVHILTFLLLSNVDSWPFKAIVINVWKVFVLFLSDGPRFVPGVFLIHCCLCWCTVSAASTETEGAGTLLCHGV